MTDFQFFLFLLFIVVIIIFPTLISLIVQWRIAVKDREQQKRNVKATLDQKKAFYNEVCSYLTEILERSKNR